jgi:hypothetical protein
MSQLLDQFLASVHDFNACETAADYQNLIDYYDLNATVTEVDTPTNTHGVGVHPPKPGNQDIVDYLSTSQPARWPRFWPTQIIETPTNSDTAATASLDGLAIYFDSAKTASATSFVLRFHFDYIRNTKRDWVVERGSGNRVL